MQTETMRNEAVAAKKLSRRSFMKAAASVGGLAALSASVPVAAKVLAPRELDRQKHYMAATLTRYTAHTQRIKREYVQLFVDRFAEVYGVVDYQQMFSGVLGEYRLVKLFMKSIFRKA